MMAGQEPPGKNTSAGAGSTGTRSAGPAAADGLSEGLEVIGSGTFALHGDVHRLVTFLNRCLKDEELIFGLTRVDDGKFRLTVYRS